MLMFLNELLLEIYRIKMPKNSTPSDKILSLLKSGKEENVSLAFALMEGQKMDVDAFVKSYQDILQFLYLDKEPIEKAFVALFEQRTYYQSNHFGQSHSYSDIDDRPFPDGFWKLSNLESIHLEEVRITTIPSWIGEMKNLGKLKIEYCGLESIPDEIAQLTNLKELTLSESRIAQLPDNFGALQNLKELNLTRSQISQLPDSFGALKSLEKLVLKSNRIQSLPQSFAQLSNLQYLDISHNKMDIDFDLLAPLQNLKYLNFSNNKIPRVGRVRLRRALQNCKITF